jgi:acetyl esterase/lipase
MMKGAQLCLVVTAWVALSGCGRQHEPLTDTSSPSPLARPQGKAPSLAEARRGTRTGLVRRESAKEPVPSPPPDLFRTVRYGSTAGQLAAYVTPDPQDGKKHPAIIWITGGDCNTIGDVWSDATANNDQTASAFRKAGIIMMFPSLRGGNENPGFREGFFGEVDDVLSAADYLAAQGFVDPKRIYLGGHSTGGTLALLVAEVSDRFRAVFSFGPVEDVAEYGPEFLPFDTSSARERELRAPILWLRSIESPTFVFEGAQSPSNLRSLKAMARMSSNPAIRFLPVEGMDHFSVLAPITQHVARKVIADDGPTTNLAFTEKELSSL